MQADKGYCGGEENRTIFIGLDLPLVILTVVSQPSWSPARLPWDRIRPPATRPTAATTNLHTTIAGHENIFLDPPNK